MQGRNYLSSSPSKTKSNGIKFRILKKHSVIDPPTIQITPNNNQNNSITILDSINGEEENWNSSNNMKQMILSKISKQGTPNQIIDTSCKNGNAYKSLKKQRMANSNNINQNNTNSYYNSSQSNNRDVNASNISQIFDTSVISKFNSSIQMENSGSVPHNSAFDQNMISIRSHNQCRVEDFFEQKHEIHTAPLKNRPRMNLQKINKVKQINFDLENTLCRQSPVPSPLPQNQNGNASDYNHKMLFRNPVQITQQLKTNRNNQIEQLIENEKVQQRFPHGQRHSSVERKRVKGTPNVLDHKEFFIQSSPLPDYQFKEKINFRSKENQQIYLNQLQQNGLRQTDKSISLHPKNLF